MGVVGLTLSFVMALLTNGSEHGAKATLPSEESERRDDGARLVRYWAVGIKQPAIAPQPDGGLGTPTLTIQRK